MDIGNILNSALAAWALLGLLMLFLVGMAFLKNRWMIKERAAIFIIGVVMLLALFALSIREP